jgi:hypothetical protein
MSDNNKSKPNHWVAGLVVAFLILMPILFLLIANYADGIFCWDYHQKALLLSSSGAVFSAILLLFWVHRLEKIQQKNSQTEIKKAEDKQAEAEQQHLIVANILDNLGWALGCLAIALSEARSQWHILREVFFILGSFGGGLVAFNYIWRYKYPTGVLKSYAKYTSLFLAALYLAIPCYLAWRYFTGAQSIF